MSTEAEARKLAAALIEVGNGAGLETTALLTDMHEPLANCAGNAIEMLNAVNFLKGRRDSRLHEVVLALGAELAVRSGLQRSAAEALEALHDTLESGRAAGRFARMVTELGGPTNLMERPERYLAIAPLIRPVAAGQTGVINTIDTRALGLAVIALGGGRRKPSDRIDHAVGLSGLARRGAKVEKGAPLAMVHARAEDTAIEAAAMVSAAYAFGAEVPSTAPVLAWIG
jgi:thymidine phosphorylase